MDITKICYDVGYNSYTHFFSNFTKIIGETPYTYRKNNFDMSNQEEAQKRNIREQSKLSGQKCRICEYQAPFIKRICRALKGMNRETLELLIQEFYNMGKESVEKPDVDMEL